ncbi:MAG: hypothetical protein M1355_01145 [Patescibacteria group bacterium]|nr:hypothetical protein [Patescibacteria group bacterium]
MLDLKTNPEEVNPLGEEENLKSGEFPLPSPEKKETEEVIAPEPNVMPAEKPQTQAPIPNIPPVVSPQKPSGVQNPQTSPLPVDSEAEDTDSIEKPWVDKAEEIIKDHKSDPYTEEEDHENLEIEYLSKRFGKNIKKGDD